MSAGAAFAGVEATSLLLGGFMDRSVLRAQARVHEENARLSLLRGEEQIARTLREERQVSGAAIAAMAGSGAVVGSGTAADIIEQNAIEREVEVGNLRAQAQGEARNFRQAAADARYSGDQALIGAGLAAASRVGSFAAQIDAQNKVDAQIEAERAARLNLVQVNRGAAHHLVPMRPRPRATFGVLTRPGVAY